MADAVSKEVEQFENDFSLKRFCENLPKVELHAHLNGSLSCETLKHIKFMKSDIFEHAAKKTNELDMPKCFDYFGEIHRIMDNQEAIQFGMIQVIKDFEKDGTLYLELRTTPKNINKMTKSDYIEACLNAIEKSTSKNIEVKLLLSIDRKCDIKSAQETVELASRYSLSSSYQIVGVDLSGNPNVGDARDFIPSLQYAQRQGLKISAHLAEIPDQNDETLEVLKKIIPDRIGHGIFLRRQWGGTTEIERIVEENKIPLELCLSSNVYTKQVKSFDQHHFQQWYPNGHPVSICTDDQALFDTSLSKEYFLVGKNFNLTKFALYDLSEKSIDYSFADEATKKSLKEVWSNFVI